MNRYAVALKPFGPSVEIIGRLYRLRELESRRQELEAIPAKAKSRNPEGTVWRVADVYELDVTVKIEMGILIGELRELGYEVVL